MVIIEGHPDLSASDVRQPAAEGRVARVGVGSPAGGAPAPQRAK